MCTIGDVGGDTIAVKYNISSITHQDGNGLTRCSVQSLTIQMIDQCAKAIDPCNRIRGQGTRYRQERGARIRDYTCTGGTNSTSQLVTSSQRIVHFPARQTFDQVETVAQRESWLVGKDGNTHVRVRGNWVGLVDRPVEPCHAVVALNADALDHDIVT